MAVFQQVRYREETNYNIKLINRSGALLVLNGASLKSINVLLALSDSRRFVDLMSDDSETFLDDTFFNMT